MSCKIKKKKFKKKRLNSLLLISFFLILFASIVSAYTIIDENVVYENSSGKLNVFPAIAKPLIPNGNVYEQIFIAEKKVVGTHEIQLAYIFNESLEYGRIFELVDGDWIDRTSFMNQTTVNGKQVYFTPAITFSDVQPTKTWKINYTPAESDSSNKWELYAWNDDINILLDPWWDPNWDYNQTVSIVTTSSALDQNFTVIINLDTNALVSAGKMQSDCDDLRVLYQDSIDLNRFVQGCDQVDTNVLFRLQNSIATSSTDLNYSIYYGNTIASSPPDENKMIFRLSEFDRNTADLTNWSRVWDEDSSEIQNGVLHLNKDNGNTSPTNWEGHCFVGDNNTFKSFVMEWDMNGTLFASDIIFDYNGCTLASCNQTDLNTSISMQANKTTGTYLIRHKPSGSTISTQLIGVNWVNSDWNHQRVVYDGVSNTIQYFQGNRLMNSAASTQASQWNPGTVCLVAHGNASDSSNFFVRNVQLRNIVANMPTVTLLGEKAGIFLSVQYLDLISGAGVKPDSWVIKGTDYIGFCDSNGLCFIADLNGFTTEEYVITATKSGADTNTLTATFGSTQKFTGVGDLTLRRTTVVLVNEDNGDFLTVDDFNGAADKHIKKVILYDINGTFIYDFNASGTTTYDIILTDVDDAYNIEITYNNAGLDVTYKKEFNFNFIYDVNTNVCVAPLQTFYEQIFTSVRERQIIVYLPNSDCYSLAAVLRNIYQEGQFANVFTINKTYQAFTFDSDGIRTFLAWTDGGSEYSHNLDAIEFNQEAVEIIAGYDTLAFVPLINSVTGRYDTNILQIYFKSYFGDYVSTNLRIFNGSTQLFEITDDINANEFVVNWDWGAYALTDQNILQIVVTGTKEDNSTEELVEYFTVSGDEFTGTRDPTYVVAMVLLIFLFGITVTSIGKTFGWIGIIICVISMGLSVMAIPGFYWVQMLQAGIFICFLYIILNSGGTSGASRVGVVR